MTELLRNRWRAIRSVFRRQTLGRDAIAGTVLGIESVPDGLAAGLLAGVNPVAGLYAYLFGMAGAAFFTSSTFMTVQATGAMSLIVSDTDLAGRPDPDRALFTLAMLTGVVMVVAGLLRLGRMLRFVPTAVMTGFVTAVGVNIVLGQLNNFTGAEGEGANRVARTIDLLLNFRTIHLPTLAVGAVTVLLIVLLTRTPLRSLGLVVAVVVGSLLTALFNEFGWGVAVISDIAEVPTSLPHPVLPTFDDILFLIVPAVSLAFVGLVQGAGVAAGIPNPGGRAADASRNFIGQGAGNIVAGVFQGMPVGGSFSASALLVASGARTRLAIFVAAAVMSLVLLFASGLVSYVAMPALAGLLMVVGAGAINPAKVTAIVKSGPVQAIVMAVTFGLTLVIPLQFAVLVGVGLGMVMFVAEQSNRLRVRRIRVESDGRLRETDPPERVGADEVIVLQPYGSLFFASAPLLAEQLPNLDAETRNSVVVIRFRGIDQIGLSHIEVLARYAHDLAERGGRLMLVVDGERMREQLTVAGLVARIGEDAVYQGTEWLGEATRHAEADAREWVRRSDFE